jgi:hypothetical protein
VVSATAPNLSFSQTLDQQYMTTQLWPFAFHPEGATSSECYQDITWMQYAAHPGVISFLQLWRMTLGSETTNSVHVCVCVCVRTQVGMCSIPSECGKVCAEQSSWGRMWIMTPALPIHHLQMWIIISAVHIHHLQMWIVIPAVSIHHLQMWIPAVSLTSSPVLNLEIFKRLIFVSQSSLSR